LPALTNEEVAMARCGDLCLHSASRRVPREPLWRPR
jgi:hypothetical protein